MRGCCSAGGSHTGALLCLRLHVDGADPKVLYSLWASQTLLEVRLQKWAS